MMLMDTITAPSYLSVDEHPQYFLGERGYEEMTDVIHGGLGTGDIVIVNGAFSNWFERRLYDTIMTCPSATHFNTGFGIRRANINDRIVAVPEEFTDRFLFSQLGGWTVTDFLSRGYNTLVTLVVDDEVLHEFSQGTEDGQPTADTIQMAGRVVRACRVYTYGANISFDDEDGYLDFHTRLLDGHLAMANIFQDGGVDASVYDDRQGAPVKLVRRMRRGQTSGEDLIELFKSAWRPGSIGRYDVSIY